MENDDESMPKIKFQKIKKFNIRMKEFVFFIYCVEG
jgi:hypothetical protein